MTKKKPQKCSDFSDKKEKGREQKHHICSNLAEAKQTVTEKEQERERWRKNKKWESGIVLKVLFSENTKNFVLVLFFQV